MAAAAQDAELRILATYILGLGHHERGAYRTSIEVLGHYLDGPDVELAKRRLGLASGSPYVLGCHRIVRCLCALGEFERALRYANDGVRAAEAADDPPAQTWAYTARALPLLAQGEFAQALPWLERAVQLCETKSVLLSLPAPCAYAGSALAWLDRPSEGLSHLERGATAAESIGAKFHFASSYLAWAEGLLRAGHIEEARHTADRALELAVAAGERGNEARTLCLLGEISASEPTATLERSASWFERALALSEELGMRPLAAHCHAGLAELARRIVELDRAQQHLTAATTMYRDLGMRFWFERAQSGARTPA